MEQTHFTIGAIGRNYTPKAPDWLVRRVVDALGVPIPRVGTYRFVPAALLPRIDAVLRSKGYTPRVEEVCRHA